MLSRLLRAIDRINQRHPWSHNDAYSSLVVRQAEQARRNGGTTALDVGCGTGNLLCRLAPLFPRVVGIEADPTTAALAASAVRRWPSAIVVNASFPAGPERYDFVSMVAVLHHLPLGMGIEAARAAVEPGGRLVIVGVYREEPRDALFSVISLLLNPIIGLLRHPQRAGRLPPGMSAPAVPATETYEQIRNALQAVLPGLKIRRGLFWRYVATWQAEG